MGRGSRGAAAALGVSRHTADHWLRAGRLHRVHHGVYALGHAALRVEGGRLAAVLACGPAPSSRHRTAAAHWGLLRTDQTRIDVTAPRGRHGAPGIRLHRSRSLDEQDTTSHEGIPITTVPRTLLDLAATVRPSELERALAQSVRLRLYDLRASTHILARANGHKGTPILARATSRKPRLPGTNGSPSAPSSSASGGLPEPQLQRRPSTSPTTASANPTSTGPNTASSSRPTASRPTHPTGSTTAPKSRADRTGHRILRFTPTTTPPSRSGAALLA